MSKQKAPMPDDPVSEGGRLLPNLKFLLAAKTKPTGVSRLPSLCKGTSRIPPIWRPSKGDKLHGNVGLGRPDRKRFELFVQGIGCSRERVAFGFELSFEVCQLLLKRLDILFGSIDVLGFLDSTTGSSNRGGSPADVRGADRFAAQEGAKDRCTD
jgi:hypothetical protein